jgi:hypothetical protein
VAFFVWLTRRTAESGLMKYRDVQMP